MKLDKYAKLSIVRAIMADVPKPDKAARRVKLQAAIVKAMSPEVRKVYNKTPDALKTHYFSDLVYDGFGQTRDLIVGDVSDDKLKELAKPYKDEDEARHEAHLKLECAVMSCSTLAALKKRLPEFEKYYPTEQQPSKNLPALANLVADLSKLGWPKKAGTK